MVLPTGKGQGERYKAHICHMASPSVRYAVIGSLGRLETKSRDQGFAFTGDLFCRRPNDSMPGGKPK